MRWTLARVSGVMWISTLLASCAAATALPPVPPLGDSILGHGDYRLSLLPGEVIDLEAGRATAPSGAEVELLAAPRARGDVNGDGAEDAGLVMRVTAPGQPPAYELVLVVNDAGLPRQETSIGLGTGIEVRGVTVDREQVEVTLIASRTTGAAEDSRSIEVRTYAVQGGTPAEAETAALAMATVSGTLMFGERMALPPTAVVTVHLLQISQADAPATLVSRQSFTTAGAQVPLAFVVAFVPAAIEADAIYVVEAEVAVEGEVLYRSVQPSRVITQGHPLRIDLILQRMA